MSSDNHKHSDCNVFMQALKQIPWYLLDKHTAVWLSREGKPHSAGTLASSQMAMTRPLQRCHRRSRTASHTGQSSMRMSYPTRPVLPAHMLFASGSALHSHAESMLAHCLASDACALPICTLHADGMRCGQYCQCTTYRPMLSKLSWHEDVTCGLLL